LTKVLHIIEGLFSTGGTGRKLLYLAEQQSNSDIQHNFFCYLPSDLTPKIEQAGSAVYNADTLSLRHIISKLIDVIDQEKPDYLCTHFVRPLFLGALCSVIKGVRFIHHEHSSTRYVSTLKKLAVGLICPFSQKIICNSRHTQRSIETSYPFSSSRTTVVYNPVKKRVKSGSCVDLRNLHNIASDASVIGHVGGMIPSRDQVSLLKAFKNLLDEFPNSHLVLIGDGPCKSELQGFVDNSDLKSRVTLLGYTEHIADYLNLFDIYVNPTIDEGFGIAVVEAMLAGIPVVVANSGAHPEIVQHEKTGLLYSPKSIDELHTSLRRLLTDLELRASISMEASRMSAQKFSPEAYSNNYTRILLHANQRHMGIRHNQ